VLQSHWSFAHTTAAYGQGVLGITEDDVTISVPKLFFGYAMGTNLFFPFSVGARSVLYPDKPTPERLFELVRAHRPTVLVKCPPW
jgi:acyl-coenzyme A synthetase/AMP-(fatty) acid ligase